jgi:hypothetical protein
MKKLQLKNKGKNQNKKNKLESNQIFFYWRVKLKRKITLTK